MKITTVGIDLAKSVFHVHGVDERGKAVLRKQLKRGEVLKFFVSLPACLIGMEACGSAHYWARKLIELRHNVRLMAPAFVKPYVKTNKNDYNDAEAICEAVGRPNMRFVPVKPRAASLAGAALCPLRLGQGAHRAGQSDPRVARRIRHRAAAFTRQCITVHNRITQISPSIVLLLKAANKPVQVCLPLSSRGTTYP